MGVVHDLFVRVTCVRERAEAGTWQLARTFSRISAQWLHHRERSEGTWQDCKESAESIGTDP